jgi:hypothetical protein
MKVEDFRKRIFRYKFLHGQIHHIEAGVGLQNTDNSEVDCSFRTGANYDESPEIRREMQYFRSQRFRVLNFQSHITN